MPISEAKKAFLSKYLDADTIGKLEADTGALKAAAEAAGVDWKEAEAVDVAVEQVAAAPTIDMEAITESVASKLVDRLLLKDLSTMVADIKATTDGLPAIVARMDALEATMQGVKKSDDEKIAKALTPKAAEVFAWANYRPSQAKETVLKEGDPVDETLKAAQPSAFADFVSQAMRGGN